MLGWNPHPNPASNPFLGYWWLLKSTCGVKHFGPLKMNNRLGARSSKHLVWYACPFHSVVCKGYASKGVLCLHIICILKSRFLSSNKLINCVFYLDIATLLNWRVALNCGNIVHWCRTAYNLSMSWCRPSSGCLSTVVQIVTHVACLITFSTCVALAVYFAPVEVTSLARIFVGGGEAPGRRHPALHQSCTSVKLSRAAGDLWALHHSAESWVEPQNEI